MQKKIILILKKNFQNLEDIDIKIRKEISDLFTEPFNICFKDMDKFEEK